MPWQDGEWQQTPALTNPDLVERFHLQKQISQALSSLPVGYRAPLLLYSHYGFSVREVARALELSEGAVKTRLYRAREMFRQAYGADGDLTDEADEDAHDAGKEATRLAVTDETENDR